MPRWRAARPTGASPRSSPPRSRPRGRPSSSSGRDGRPAGQDLTVSGGPRPARRSWALRPLVVAASSTAIVFGVLGLAIVNAPGWPRVQAAFFDPVVFQAALPRIVDTFWINIQLFLIA